MTRFSHRFRGLHEALWRGHKEGVGFFWSCARILGGEGREHRPSKSNTRAVWVKRSSTLELKSGESLLLTKCYIPQGFIYLFFYNQKLNAVEGVRTAQGKERPTAESRRSRLWAFNSNLTSRGSWPQLQESALSFCVGKEGTLHTSCLQWSHHHPQTQMSKSVGQVSPELPPPRCTTTVETPNLCALGWRVKLEHRGHTTSTQ